MSAQPGALVAALMARFGARLVIRPGQSHEVFGWSKATSIAMIHRGELPPLRQFGGPKSRVTGWLTSEIIERLVRAPTSTLIGPRSPGRPRKQTTAGESG